MSDRSLTALVTAVREQATTVTKARRLWQLIDAKDSLFPAQLKLAEELALKAVAFLDAELEAHGELSTNAQIRLAGGLLDQALMVNGVTDPAPLRARLDRLRVLEERIGIGEQYGGVESRLFHLERLVDADECDEFTKLDEALGEAVEELPEAFAELHNDLPPDDTRRRKQVAKLEQLARAERRRRRARTGAAGGDPT